MNSEVLSPLARRLREARKLAGFTQEQLGIKAGIDESGVSARMSQYENDVHTPDFSFIKKVATVLDLPTAYFYCEEDKLAAMIKTFKED